MSFLPEGYEQPKSAGNKFMKFEDGENKFRVLTDAIVGWQYFTEDNQPVRLKEAPTKTPADIKVRNGKPDRVQHFWAFLVLDRADGQIKHLTITQTRLQADMINLIQSADWMDIKKYDVTVTKSGSGLDTKYTVAPSMPKALTPDEMKLFAESDLHNDTLVWGEGDTVAVTPAEDDGIPTINM